MTRRRKTIIAAAVLASLGAALLWMLTRSDTARIARDAYIYGYPLITFDMVRRQQTNATKPGDERAPILERDLEFMTDHGNTMITQDELGNTYDRVGGPYSNYQP